MSQVNENVLAWVKEFFVAADTLNIENVTEFYAENAVLQYGNNPLLEGRQNILDMFKKLFELLDQMKHEIGHTDVLSDRIYQYVQVSYKVKGDAEVIKIPALAVLHKTPDEEKMRRFEVFIDTSTLMARIKSLGLI